MPLSAAKVGAATRPTASRPGEDRNGARRGCRACCAWQRSLRWQGPSRRYCGEEGGVVRKRGEIEREREREKEERERERENERERERERASEREREIVCVRARASKRERERGGREREHGFFKRCVPPTHTHRP